MQQDTKGRRCPVCDRPVDDGTLSQHLRQEHGDIELQRQVLRELSAGRSLEDIGRRYGLSFGQIQRIVTSALGVNVSSLARKTVRRLHPRNFRPETTTVWSFKARGSWATHSGRYRGNWSPYIPRNVILRYSQPGDLVLDPFVGGGTTAVEAKLLGRRCIGVDINPAAVALTQESINFDVPPSLEGTIYEPEIHVGDARDLGFLESNSVDLVCAHPPYAGIVGYSEGVPGDISRGTDEEYIRAMDQVARELHRVLKPGRYCAVLLGDTRRKRRVVPLAFAVIQRFLERGFLLRELVIKRQHNCRTTGFWYRRSIEYGFLLLAHEYLPIFQKVRRRPPADRTPGQYIRFEISPAAAPVPERLETTTVWLLRPEGKREHVLGNLIARYAGEDQQLFEAVPLQSQMQASPEPVEGILLVRFAESIDPPSVQAWEQGVLQLLAKARRPVIVECQDVRDEEGFIIPVAAQIVWAARGLPCLDLRECIILVDQTTSAQSGNSPPADSLSIVHRYLLVFDVPRSAKK